MDTTHRTIVEVLAANRRPGESRVEFARRLGYTEGALRYIETGVNVPRGEHRLTQLAAALGLTYDEVASACQAARVARDARVAP